MLCILLTKLQTKNTTNRLHGEVKFKFTSHGFFTSQELMNKSVSLQEVIYEIFILKYQVMFSDVSD